MIKLKGKDQVRPSQDNRDFVVKKLEKGSDITSSTFQQDHKSIKHKIPRKKSLGYIKCYRCLEKGHYARNYQIKPNEEERLSRSQRKLSENRVCFGCRKKGHLVHCCPHQFRSDQLLVFLNIHRIIRKRTEDTVVAIHPEVFRVS